MEFVTLDYAVFIGYCALIIFLGLYVSREKKGHKKDSKDYFLASKGLTWWAIGASLIASNISAEQFIGMSGSGYAIGLAIATYEWMAALTLIVVAKFFLPIFLKKGIFTMPQFLEQRFDSRVKTTMAVFWLMVYTFVNLTSILYLGALALRTIMGVPMMYGIAGLALFSALYSIYGGLKAVAWTDIVQVIFLVGGGLMTSYLALDHLSDGQGFIAGLKSLYEHAPEKFSMILDKGEIMIPQEDGTWKDAYIDLPGLSVLFGAMWIANLSYWGCNQYIIQRALGAKNLKEAQNGLAFAGYLKLILPLIVVIPGIVAFVLKADIVKPDGAYPWLLSNFVPAGFKGLAFAALIAAVVSSLSSMINSIATIFTMDIYKPFFNQEASEGKLVNTGRLISGVCLVIAIIVAPALSSLEQAFQFIQEFTGFISPGVVAIFLFGLFWKKATPNSALWAALLSIPLSFLFKVLMPALPFLDRMGFVFLALCAVIIGISLYENKDQGDKAISLEKGLFNTSNTFNMLAIGICGLLVVLYTLLW